MTIIFACIYVPPDFSVSHSTAVDDYIISNSDTFLSKLHDFDIVLCGDFNRFDTNSLCNQLYLENLVHEPTRNSALLDYVLVSKTISSYFSVSVGPPIANSDHNSISALPVVVANGRNVIQRPVYDLRESNVSRFLAVLANTDWTSFYVSRADVDTKCKLLHDFLSDVVQQCIPVRMVTMNEKDKPWMTPLVKHAIQMRWDAYRRRNFSLYNHWKVKVKELVKKAKQKWSLKAKNSPKDLWSTVKSEIGTKNKNFLYSLTKKFDSLASATNAINERFSCVYVPDKQAAPILPEDDDRGWPTDITVSIVERMFSTIKSNKAMGPDGIPSVLYQKGSIYLAGPFAHIFNLSIQERTFPEVWKHSHVCPIPKTTPPDIENLRPIALLPVPAKVFERLILRSVRATFLHNFGDNQYGCRPASSTTCAVISLRHHALTALESSKVSGVKIIAYDFSKAFDKLSHNLVIKKLTEAKFPTNFIRWTHSYLRNRTQATRIGHALSASSEVTSGVPQGSVLGPMFFCLAVGDLKPVHSFTKVIQYVDDTTLCLPLYKGSANCHVNEEHSQILKWACSNGFVVNAKKCQSLFFSKSQDARDIDLEDAPTVDVIKFLGFFLNRKLNFNTHIERVCRQAARRFYALRILKPLLSEQDLIAVYHGVVRPILEYGSPAFGKLPKNLEEDLDKIQRRCHRLICGVSRPSQCPCDRFSSLSSRRHLMSIKLFVSAAVNKSHILHTIIPTQSQRSARFIQPASSTTRHCHSFVPFTTMLLNGFHD